MASKSAQRSGGRSGQGKASADRPRAVIWMAPNQIAFIEKLVKAASLDVVAIGCDERSVAAELASKLEADVVSDLRMALATPDVKLTLIASLGRSGEAESSRQATRNASGGAGGAPVTMSMSPVPGSVAEAAGDDRRGAGVRLAPLMRRSPGFDAASEVFESFAPVSMLSLSARCGREHGALSSQLFDAMDIVHAVLGEPEMVDASAQGPRSQGGLRLAPGDSLRDLRGALSAHLRFADGRSAAITLTDNAGRWFRGVTLLGDAGCLRVRDFMFEWIGPDGRQVDAADRTPLYQNVKGAKNVKGKKCAVCDDGAVLVMAEEIRLALDSHAPPKAPPDVVAVLAMAEAALLSARTGQPESPATIRRMAGAM